jgi:MtrB/PioB family decaheme-associated outer membrane protein
MKPHTPNVKLSTLTLAVSCAIAPMCVDAEEGDAEATSGPANTVEFGLSSTSKSSAKFGEYNGLNKSGVGVVGNVNLNGGDSYNNMGGLTRWSLFATDIGLSTRTIGGDYGQHGRWRIGLKYDELRHNLTDTYQTPYLGNMGGNTFVLPSGFGTAPGNNTNNLTAGQKAAFHILDVYSSRKNYTLNSSVNLGPQWTVKLDYNRLDQAGAKLQGFGLSPIGGAGLGEYISILPMPTSYQTDTVNFSLNWAGEKAHFTGAYYGSYFHDNFDRVVFQSWAGANVLNTMSTPPSNMFHQLNLSGGYALSKSTRLVGNFSYALNTQNQAFAYDPSLMVTPSPLPAANAKVYTTHADLKLSNQTTRDLALSGAIKYDDRDNHTASNIYNFNAISGGNTANYPNTPLSYRKALIELAGDYRLKKDHHIRLALTHEDIHRWCNNYGVNANYPPGTNCVVAKASKEDKADATYRINAFDAVTFRFGYGYSNRRVDSDPFARAAFISTNGTINGVSVPGQNGGDFLGFHPALDASRIQNALKASANWDVNERLGLGLSGRYTNDDYKTLLGLQKGLSWSVNLDATFRYAENGALSAYATRLYRDRAMTDQQRTLASASAATATAIAVPAGATWSDKLTDKDVTVGLGLKHTGLIGGKLDLNGDATYSWATSNYYTQFNYATTTTGGLTCADPSILSCGSPPDVRTTITQLKFSGSYKLDKKSKVALRYIYQHLSGADYYYNGYQTGFTPNQVMPTNQQLGTHTVNFVSLSYLYSY